MNKLYLRLLGIFHRFPNLFSIVIIVIFSWLMYGGAIIAFWQAPYINGFDGSFHYEIVKEYSQNYFPNLYGWIDSWNAGSPWPIAYPPLFTYSFSLLDKVIVNPLVTFKIIVTFCSLIIPVLIFLISKNFSKSRFSQLMTGILGVFFMISSENMAGTLGVTVLSSLQNGLYPQLFASIFFLLWFYFFTKYQNTNRVKFLLSSIFLSLTLLANLHVAEPAAVIFIVFFLIDIFSNKKKIHKFIIYLLYGIFVLGLVAFWLLPLLTTREYFLSRALAQVPFDSFVLSIIIWLFFAVIVFIYSVKNKRTQLLSISVSAFLIFLITILPLKDWLPFLPLQPFRLFPFAYLLCLLVTPIGIKIILQKLNIVEYLKVFVVVFMLILMLFYTRLDKNIVIYDLTENDKQVITFLDKMNARSMIEAYSDPSLIPTHTLISSMIPDNSDSEVLWGVFRESAFNSPSIVPIRNGLSIFQESFGIACLLCSEYNPDTNYVLSYATQDLSRHIDRLRLFGVEYVAIHDKEIKIALGLNADKLGIEPAFTNASWKIFKIKNVSRAYDYKGKFVGVYTDIITGDRGMNDIDWHRLNEEWLRLSNYSYLFQKLDGNTSLDKFDIIFVNQYIDSSEIEKLKEYSQKHTIVSLDKFKDRLKEIPNIIYLEQDSIKISNYFNSRFQENIRFDENFELINFSKSKNSFQVESKNDNDEKRFVVAVSYFPWWKSENGEANLVSPGIIELESTKNKIIKFQFVASEIADIGSILTAFFIFIAFLLFGYLTMKRLNIRRKQKMNSTL